MPVGPLETLLEFFVELHPDDAARAFESLDRDEAERLFASLPEDVVVELANRLDAPPLVSLLRSLTDERAGSILSLATNLASVLGVTYPFVERSVPPRAKNRHR